jgi:hypothetical protein
MIYTAQSNVKHGDAMKGWQCIPNFAKKRSAVENIKQNEIKQQQKKKDTLFEH